VKVNDLLFTFLQQSLSCNNPRIFPRWSCCPNRDFLQPTHLSVQEQCSQTAYPRKPGKMIRLRLGTSFYRLMARPEITGCKLCAPKGSSFLILLAPAHRALLQRQPAAVLHLCRANLHFGEWHQHSVSANEHVSELWLLPVS
jgi:hypothetical protein